ncbi:MAG: thiamine pyrophosphate-dependent dehydrogenase E1 component subunit alpha [Actinobacteria bacterium]|nr:thiamine pyrophosphate-dependent dehydrogenase E1 component subunit alpha [Actinomycetota bacterium]
MTEKVVLKERGESWLRTMVRGRLFEQSLGELYERGELVGVVHLSIGLEATAAGVCSNLRKGDQITSTHRGHNHMIARGLEPERMFAEILGRSTGYCGGKGGSMHVANFELGSVGANGIVGAGVPMAAGLGVAAQKLGTGNVAVAFCGDGAANQGVVWESLNLAALWKIPVIFVCENNGFSEFTPTDRVTAGPGIADRAIGYGVSGVVVDGTNVGAVSAVAEGAIDRARSGEGPTFIETRAERWRGHHEGEESYVGTYRETKEFKDPIVQLIQEMDAAGLDGSLLYEKIHAEEKDLIERSLAVAQQAPLPELSTALEDVFS